MRGLKNKVALVTGAGVGIGRAAAKALLKGGYKVVLTGRNLEKLQKAITDIGGTSENCLAVACDVGKPDQVKNLFKALKERFGRIDVLFNNAGTGAPGTIMLEDLSIEMWQNVVNVNLSGVFYCMQEAFRLMKDQSPRGGRIINNGSISAHAPRPFSVAYTSTKHAITGLTKSTSLDGRAYDIACGQIDIGNAVSPMTERMTKGVPQPNGTTMVEPRMDVEAVANAIVYMDSLPLDANVQFMTVMATKMPFVGRG